MTGPIDPTAALYLPAPRGPVVPLRYRSGFVVFWNQSTAESTIRVDGVTLTNLPVQPGPYVGLIEENDTVSLLSTTDQSGVATYCVVGLALPPGARRIARAALRLGYGYERRERGTIPTTDAPPTNLGDFPTFSQPVRLIAASPESSLEIRVEGTLYGPGSSTDFDIGVLVNGTDDYIVATGAAANANANAHTQYAGTVVVPTGSAGTKTVTPRWRYNAGAAARVDAGDWFVITVRETFIR